jgi:hypothetical protein
MGESERKWGKSSEALCAPKRRKNVQGLAIGFWVLCLFPPQNSSIL